MNEILTVSGLTKLIKLTLEEEFTDISVEGEISNYKAHVSGHWYFNLKDSTAVINCTMWRGLNSYVFFTPTDGMKIIVSGRITVYPPRGNYQLEVRSMKPAGEGELQAAFERLKRKLQAEGLFDEQFKKPIPSFAKKIGIVTAIDGAAFRDLISIARRRFPLIELVIAPSKVQGEGAAISIVESIEMLNTKKDIDLIIVGRGGGSLEDLWAFNEEAVARAIFASNIPVVSAVGHEVDFTIADFVADLRAATPSAAMEIVTPNQEDLMNFLEEFSLKSTEIISYILDDKKKMIWNIMNSYGFRVPQDKVKIKIQELDNLFYRVQQKIDGKLNSIKNKFQLLVKDLEANDLKKILKKGFVLVRQDTKIISRAKQFDGNLPASLNFYDNEIVVKKTL
ncbi:MAG: exodeoxyribonuclease VII large subunit [Ignavibacteriales bacterium]|nr:exodeoxyribonuclease VII large subunit [Ignavibacteriales bacterium]